MMKEMSYSDKIKYVFTIILQQDFHNYKWREKIQLESLGLVDNRGYKINGPDNDNYSLKSSLIKSNKDGKYKITNRTSLGMFGRVDKDRTYDIKDTYCSIFNIMGEEVLGVKIEKDDNFIKMYETIQNEKRNVMISNKQGRDSVTINFNLIKTHQLKYVIYKISDNVILSFDI